MATQLVNVPAGTTSAIIAINPLISVTAGPAVLGGTVTIQFSPSMSVPQNQWPTVATGTAGVSYQALTTGYIIVTATTQAANVFMSDIGCGASGGGTIVSINAPLATASATAEQVLATWRIPSNFFKPNWLMSVTGSVGLTNNANVKTLILRANGPSGTAIFTSPSLASAVNFSFEGWLAGRLGQTIVGGGLLASQTSAQGGYGINTTAQPSLTRDFINNATDFTLTATKATGTDTMQLEALRVVLS